MDIELERELLRERLLGWSARCDRIEPNGDIGHDVVLIKGPAGLDLDRVRSMDTLAQSLRIALMTRLGADIFNTRFGFDGLNALVEETNHILVRERIRISVIKVLKSDPRVKRILDVKLTNGQLEPAPDGVFKEPEDGKETSQDDKGNQRRTLNIGVAFETINGDQATINLGGIPGNV
jgi:phage baseplate assembly protein W